MKFNKLRKLLKPLLRRNAPSLKSTFNPSPEQVLSLNTKPILFIHVGKCAGTSIRDSLLNLIPTGFTLHEMHCRDANSRIAEIVENDDGEIEYVICTRDPVARFISAFNWDKHNMHFQGTLKGRKEGLAYDQFPTINAIVQGLQSYIVEERQLATVLATSKSLHMGMGQSWYTPLEVVERLPLARTSVIDAYAVKDGIIKLTQKLGCEPPDPTWTAPWEKSDYKLSYPDHEKEFPTSLSAKEETALQSCIEDDINVYRKLLKIQ
jgi:hypothetical protein